MLTRRTLIATAAALALPLIATFAQPTLAQEAAAPLPDVVLGNEDAPVTVIEYASMTCPHCASFHQGPFKALKEEYIDTGKVRFIMREFPFDARAAAVSMLARCSDDNYFEVVDLFFERQAEWSLAEDGLTAIRDLAKQAGFTNQTFEACLKDQELLDGINAVRAHGHNSMGVTATPTLFINGEELQGVRSIEALRAAIDPKLGS